MTTKTHARADFRALRRKIDDLRIDDATIRELYTQVLKDFLTAADYQDLTLMRSAMEETKVTLGQLASDEIERGVPRSALVLDSIRRISEQLEGEVIEPDEEFDDIGRSISTVVSRVLGSLTSLRDGWLAAVQKHGIDVPNAAKLDEHIAQWQSVKANLVDCWPWSTVPVPLPPADREMIAASRAALQAGERGESLEAVIERRRSK